MEKTIQKKKENANHQLYDHLKGRMNLMHQTLRSLYFGSDQEGSAEAIHRLRRDLYHLNDVLFDLLFDQWEARKVLEHFDIKLSKTSGIREKEVS